MTNRQMTLAVVGALSILINPIEVTAGEGSSQEPPHIEVPRAKVRQRLDLTKVDLPPGMRGHFGAYDGDPFYVTLPIQQQADVSADDVFKDILRPLLHALRFKHIESSIRKAPSRGIPLPVANLQGVAQAMEYEYGNNRELLRQKTLKMIEVMLGRIPPDEEINRAFEMGEGMTFAQYRAGIERLKIQYPFPQTVRGVPIEHTLVVASRWEGQGVHAVRGNLYFNYRIGNEVLIPPEKAVPLAIDALGFVKGIQQVTSRTAERGPSLVLLPYGTGRRGVARLLYAYRIGLRAVSFGFPDRPFLLWLDAQSGLILKLDPLLANDSVSAKGKTWKRDPGVLGTTTSFFRVDESVGGEYTLQLGGVFQRVNYLGDDLFYDYNDADVSISDAGPGSDATFANFDIPGINEVDQALCESGTNKKFQQVHIYATLYRDWADTVARGIFEPFPTSAIPIHMDESQYCGANALLEIGRCDGYLNAACPDFWDGTAFDEGSFDSCMNYSHDRTVIGHELGHWITPRLTEDRPDDWCCAPGCGVGETCEMPVGWLLRFHDLSDAWADHFESTNCEGGWVCKNRGGVDQSLYCNPMHSENGDSPRLHLVTWPFNPDDPLDHFPEHRVFGTDQYSNMQMPTAALWQVRSGMASKCRPSGIPQYGVRFQRAMRETGFLGTLPPNTDLGLHQMLYDLELSMAEEWITSGSPGGPPAFAHNGPHSTNKVTAGFARAGLFLIPYQCLDDDPLTTEATSCPAGENGADAVIDIDDNDADDGPEVDFLELGGPAPTFHVWTGARYRFHAATGAATYDNPSPCNKKFQVEVANDPTFPVAGTITSPWVIVDTNPISANTPECYDTWTPNNVEWATLQAGDDRIYYRARTRDNLDGNERISTTPGNVLWDLPVPPPYAVITADGQSDY